MELPRQVYPFIWILIFIFLPAITDYGANKTSTLKGSTTNGLIDLL
jgi:hypothetical protein